MQVVVQKKSRGVAEEVRFRTAIEPGAPAAERGPTRTYNNTIIGLASEDGLPTNPGISCSIFSSTKVWSQPSVFSGVKGRFIREQINLDTIRGNETGEGLTRSTISGNLFISQYI